MGQGERVVGSRKGLWVVVGKEERIEGGGEGIGSRERVMWV